MNNSTVKNRMQEVDVARGLGILLVIIGNLVHFDGVVFRLIFSFHMAFFFMMSGFCSPDGGAERSMKDMFLSLLQKVLIPSLVVRFIVAYFFNQATFFDGLIQMLTPSAEWFFSSLFLSRLVFYLINHFFNKCRYLIYTMLLIVLPFLARTYLNAGWHDASYLFFPYDSACLGLSFIIIGALLRKAKEHWSITSKKIIHYIKNHKISLSLSLCIMVMLSQMNGYVNICDVFMGTSEYLFYMLAILGSVALYGISVLLYEHLQSSSFLRWFVFLGKNTMLIYPGHIIINKFLCTFIFWITGIMYTPMFDLPALYVILFFVIDILVMTGVSKIYEIYQTEKRNFNVQKRGAFSLYFSLFAFVAAMLSSLAGAIPGASDVLFLMSIIALGYLPLLSIKKSNYRFLERWMKQLTVFYLFLAAFWDISIYLCTYSQTDDVNHVILVAGLIVFNFSAAAGLSILLKHHMSKRGSLLSFFQKNAGILIFLLVYFLININGLSYWIKSDSNVYYTCIVKQCGNWDFTLRSLTSSFSLGGHLSYGYSIFAFIGQAIFPVHGIGIRLVDIGIYFVSIVMFWKILQMLFPKATRIEVLLYTMFFAFTPIVSGILFEINIDLPLLCFFIWFIYFHMTDKKILCFLAALLLCFSKELGSLFVVGFFISRYFYNRIILKKKQSLSGTSMLTMAIGPYLFFQSTICAREGWAKQSLVAQESSGLMNATIQFSPHYIFIKLKQIFALNFQWIFVILVLFLVVMVIARKLKVHLNEIGFCLTVLFCGSVLFNFLYFTFTHSRYLQIEAFFFGLFWAYVWQKLVRSGKIRIILVSFFTMIFAVESIITLDPLSLALFRNVNVGERKIISLVEYATLPETGAQLLTEEENEKIDLKIHILRDYVQYNKDYIHLEKIIEKALDDMNYTSDIAICIPPIFQDTAYTYENLFGFDVNLAYWDAKTKNVFYNIDNIESEHYYKIQWVDVTQAEEWLKNGTEVWYFDFPFQTLWDKDGFLRSYEIEQTLEENSIGWSMKAYKLNMKG